MVSDGTRTLTWDAQNKLASVTPLGGGQAVTFQYGPDGSRIAKLSSFTGKRIYADADFEIAPDGAFILYPHADPLSDYVVIACRAQRRFACYARRSKACNPAGCTAPI